MYNIKDIQALIEKRHSGDAEQLEVIFSSENRILVEAPAGYGKTNTMISKIAYLIATHQIANPKKLLALTFSVNASYKIKQEVKAQIPAILATDASGENKVVVNDKIFVSNYHGFCRHILKRYGYLLHDELSNIDLFKSIDDKKTDTVLNVGISSEIATFLSSFSNSVQTLQFKFLRTNFHLYNERVIQHLIAHRYIPYNAIITLTCMLFQEHPTVLSFYQKFFPVIMIDEFQDTNILSYWFIRRLIAPSTKTVLFGDSLQRIYGFIGAIPRILQRAQETLQLQSIHLKQNYRFRNNSDMLLLDQNIRRNAEEYNNTSISENVKLDFYLAQDQDEEALYVVNKTHRLTDSDPLCRVAILVKQRGANTDRILQQFHASGVDFFYGLFTDEDSEYLLFHQQALDTFLNMIKDNKTVSKRLLLSLLRRMQALYSEADSPLIESLLQLLSIFTDCIVSRYSYLENEDKIALIRETFENNALKQSMEFVETQVIISTIHGAKGLEWDVVIIPDMEQYSAPNYWGLCRNCKYHSRNCNIEVNTHNETKFLEELSVFYVAVTRAKEMVYFSASKVNGNEKKCNVSCFLKMRGINYED